MKIALASIVILCGLSACYSQELKKVTKQDKNSTIVEEYFVLKKDKDVKHGLYQKMIENGIVLERGFYKNNLKDSLWIYFASNGIDTTAIGFYIEDKRAGPWIINDAKGGFSYVYDYSSGKVSNYKWNGVSNRFPVLVEDKWIEDEIDSPPLIIDGEHPKNTIVRNLRYPTRAWKGGISGEVLVKFTVDSTGRMSNVKLKEGVDPDLDKEALRLVGLVNTLWYPAQKNSKPVTIEYFLPVKFTLRK